MEYFSLISPKVLCGRRSVERPIVNTGKSPDYLFWMVREEIAYAFMEKKKKILYYYPLS